MVKPMSLNQESGIKPGLERMNAYLDRYKGSPSCPVIAVGVLMGGVVLKPWCQFIQRWVQSW